jgi:hypothetical protein
MLPSCTCGGHTRTVATIGHDVLSPSYAHVAGATHEDRVEFRRAALRNLPIFVASPPRTLCTTVLAMLLGIENVRRRNARGRPPRRLNRGNSAA